jgi:hypothetical protein
VYPLFLLERRFTEATALPADLAEWFKRQPTYHIAEQAIAAAHAEAQKTIDALNKVANECIAEVRKAVAEADDKPGLASVEIKPETKPEPAGGTVFDSRDTFIDATRKLQRIKREYMADNDDDDNGNIGDDPGARGIRPRRRPPAPKPPRPPYPPRRRRPT